MKFKISDKESKNLLEILRMEIEISGSDMGDEVDDILEQAEWIYIAGGIYRRLKRARSRSK